MSILSKLGFDIMAKCLCTMRLGYICTLHQGSGKDRYYLRAHQAWTSFLCCCTACSAVIRTIPYTSVSCTQLAATLMNNRPSVTAAVGTYGEHANTNDNDDEGIR